jgi:hypothetical protein
MDLCVQRPLEALSPEFRIGRDGIREFPTCMGKNHFSQKRFLSCHTESYRFIFRTRTFPYRASQPVGSMLSICFRTVNRDCGTSGAITLRVSRTAGSAVSSACTVDFGDVEVSAVATVGQDKMAAAPSSAPTSPRKGWDVCARRLRAESSRYRGEGGMAVCSDQGLPLGLGPPWRRSAERSGPEKRRDQIGATSLRCCGPVLTKFGYRMVFLST